jgi:hypothetical protein
MKLLWCWRCKQEVPMLDEEEYWPMFRLFSTGEGRARERLWGPMKREYERITGVPALDGYELFHHRLALYGPPCRACGKPLRSPRAKLCGTCMAPVTDDPTGLGDAPKDTEGQGN